MNVKDLVVTIKANVKGLEKLRAFNQELKTFIELSRRVKGVNKVLNKMDAEALKRSIVEVDSQPQQTSREKSNLAKSLSAVSKVSSPVIASLIYIARSAYGAVKSLVTLATNLSKNSYELLKLRNNLGLSTTRLQEFGYAAVTQGAKLDDFNSAVANLRKQSVDILLGRGDITPYALLGLNPHDDPMVFLERLQGRLRELPEVLGTAFASELGLSPDMINFVRSADFRRLRERPTLSRQEISRMKELRDSALELVVAFQTFSQKLLITFSPIIKNFFDPITKHLQSAVKDTGLLKRDAFLGIQALALGLFKVNKTLALTISLGSSLFVIIEDLMKGGKGIELWMLYFKYLTLDILDAIGDKIKSIFSNGDKKAMEYMQMMEDLAEPDPEDPFRRSVYDSEGNLIYQSYDAAGKIKYWWDRFKSLFGFKMPTSIFEAGPWTPEYKEYLKKLSLYSNPTVYPGTSKDINVNIKSDPIPLTFKGEKVGELKANSFGIDTTETSMAGER